MVPRAHTSHHPKRHLDQLVVFVWVPNAMLYNALSVGKKTPKIVPSHLDFVIMPKEDQATAIGNMHNKFNTDCACGSGDIFADRPTQLSCKLM